MTFDQNITVKDKFPGLNSRQRDAISFYESPGAGFGQSRFW